MVVSFLAALAVGAQVVSYSLYGGDNRRYTDGAIANAMLMPKVYPGWTMRIYCDVTSTPPSVIRSLKEYNHVEIVEMTRTEIKAPMLWRFLVATDPTVERYIVRDIDSRLSPRDALAVDEWVASKRKFHVMHDHPSQYEFPMMGGMWGGVRGALDIMASYLTKDAVNDVYGADQDFLQQKIWPIVRTNCVLHEAFPAMAYWMPAGADVRSFPLPRIGREHVGSVFIDGQMRESDVASLAKEIDTPQANLCSYGYVLVLITLALIWWRRGC